MTWKDKKGYCSYCCKPCETAYRDDSFGYTYGSQRSVNLVKTKVSSCCGEGLTTRQFALWDWWRVRCLREAKKIEVQQLLDALRLVRPHRFPETWCSQCGRSLGPGNHGLSHCIDHRDRMKKKTCDNCEKRWRPTCNIYKQENKRPKDNASCAGWRGRAA